MFTNKEILETIDMIETQNLDVRTVTMALSLFECIDKSAKKTAQNVYEKVIACGKNLVGVCNDISKEFGVPIVNKRISVSPISLIGAASGGYIDIALALDKAALELGIDFIGGYTAFVQKEMTKSDEIFLKSIPEAISLTQRVCSSVNTASSKSGINMDAVILIGQIIKQLSECSQNAIGCAKLVIFCNAVDDNPFMAGAFNGIGEGDKIINVGVSGPGVVHAAIAKNKGANLNTVCETIKRTAFKITRVGQLVANEAAKRLNASFGIVDLSLAPSPKVGDSLAEILQEMGLESVGAHGTTACLAMLNDAVKKGGIMASSSVGGLCGAFIPVSEDTMMADAVAKGALSIDKLEAMTCVCSVGLDMIAIPGDTSAETISAIIADECAIGVINNKTTAARLIPVPGKKAGDTVFFGGLLGSAPIINVNQCDSSAFIRRGGRMPAPVHSFKN